jgi:hypothetical protein
VQDGTRRADGALERIHEKLAALLELQEIREAPPDLAALGIK